MKLNKFKIIVLSAAVLSFTSCINDLDTAPKYEQSLENILRDDPNAVEGLVAKIYASLSMSSANGAGEADISGPDKGETVFLRGIWNLEDFTADGMKNRWGDDGLDQLTTTSNWTSNNKFFAYLYNRVYYTVPQANNLIAALRNVNHPQKDQFISELRFIRALSYYYMIDCFGKGVLVTENDLGTTTPKPQASRQELFNYVENELKEIESTISSNAGYGHANQATVQMLLAKLYLNAQVYTGTARYNDAVTYINKVLAGGYSLDSNFVRLFSADNNASPEIIFPLIADPVGTESYGNSTYIINGGTGGTPPTIKASDLGLTGDGWGGHRASKAWYGLFGNSLTDYNAGTSTSLAASTDDRAKLFYSNGHNYEMNDYKNWLDGYPSIKFRNLNSNGSGNTTSNFSGADFPMFRLADVYLMYAECAVRGASGATLSQALTYVNQIRMRSHAMSVSLNDLTLDFILAERARELNLEGHRRTDLIRFGKFTGATYIWPWKGGVKNGISIPSTYNLFPIPSSALNANPNLTQNPGY
ncbi:carbohydrate-binding protein SusD [Chryseobacterium sp. FH2]|uniref:RagB/SusD family nutrient uptake outer membrane protein n=1 Tax=Chryseobacterium sp. FH2 TaxID=1674291 RepID=UPI00065ACCE8|nr:RagB/SusD family nutrient uptake outer membrane protein [Chryseobacterium sp. FH2]KMQ67779.1 carbohydrate-binding protein SusD [Chryseobacterium sp. FH2]